jgi:hypothetical protein
LSWSKLLTDVFQEEKEIQLFKKFHSVSWLLSRLDESVHDYRNRRKPLLKYLDILQESKLLMEVKDILDEIKIIESVLGDQRRVLESLKQHVGPFSETNQQLETQDLVERTTQSFQSMKERAEAVEKGVSRIAPSVLAA